MIYLQIKFVLLIRKIKRDLHSAFYPKILTLADKVLRIYNIESLKLSKSLAMILYHPKQEKPKFTEMSKKE